MNRTILERSWFRLVAVLIITATCVWLASRRPKLPNSTGIIAARVYVGLSYDDAISVLNEHHSGGTLVYMHGRTHDGRKFGGYGGWFHNLPPVDDVARVEITVVDDCSGRELYITIEPRGVVTELRLESDSIWEELRYGLAHGTGWSGWKSLVRDRSACFEYTLEHFFSAD